MSDRSWRQLLEASCRIDSRTDEGAPGTVQVAQMYGERLRELGFELQWADPLPEEEKRGRHLIAVRNSAGKKRLLLVGHTDTVLSPTDVPVRADEKAGRIYGAGVCDMKGGNVVMIEALTAALAQEATVRQACLIVLLSCSEENDGMSFRKIARTHAKDALACLCFEPTRLGPKGEHQIVTSRKGVVRFELTIRGRAAHSGNAHPMGVNANRELARKVEELESLTNAQDELTVNVGVIMGGKASNQVSEEARASFELRAYDPIVLDRACKKAHEICSKSTIRSAADGATTHLELVEFRAFPPWPRSAAGDALAGQYLGIAKKYNDITMAVPSGGGSDASHVADLIPAIDGLGILGGAMHSNAEWADLASFETRARIATDFIKDLCVNGLS